jgi:1-deoxy-D-xylulose-5-phosphate reductoisomerase
MTAVLNAANEQAVALFLDEKIHFLDIPKVIEGVCEHHKTDNVGQPTLDDILTVDQWARGEVSRVSQSLTAATVVSMS